MDKAIKKGDVVILKWDGYSPAEVLVLHTPQGQGDLFQFEYVDTGVIQAFSPTRTDYVLEKKIR
jgi:hypothetical protein